jgi:hypothetical protein
MADETQEPNIQISHSSSEFETALQNAYSTEDNTLLQSVSYTDENLEQTTRQFEFTTVATDEKELKPNKLRFTLICLLFVLAAGYVFIGAKQVFSTHNAGSGFSAEQSDQNVVITKLSRDSHIAALQVGDQIISINGVAIHSAEQVHKMISPISPDELYTLQIKRGGEYQTLELSPTELDANDWIRKYFFGLPAPLIVILLGLALFLFKPNNKIAILTGILFVSLSWTITPGIDEESIEPMPVAVWYWTGQVLLSNSYLLLLHLFLIFPARLSLVRRYPRIEWLVYLPLIFFSLPFYTLDGLSKTGFIQYDVSSSVLFQAIGIGSFCIYQTAILLAIISNYRQADEIGKRRVRILVFGVLFSLVPLLLIILPILTLSLFFSVGVPVSILKWADLTGSFLSLLIPFFFAYAILRHKVIPVSFVIRRGLQYLLAKNALRLLLILPVIGIIWNIAANPDRTVSEILFNNSFSFYFFVAVGVIDGLLIRSHLNEWIDKRFFRQQYNQEKILRQLTEDVKESDSIVKLSRLVSSRIQTALHPENVYLFFRDDTKQSNFSLGFTTNNSDGVSSNLKLAADSPILQFMQNQRDEAVEFPSRQTDELPNREKNWLHEIGANLIVPMHGTDGRLAGFFSLGEKKSEIPYTSRDKEMLETLANQIALVHENINLKDRVRQEQKIKTEVLSRFEEGNINLLKECLTCGRCFDRDEIICTYDNSKLTFTVPVERTIENRYRLEKLLGRGGMGSVYQATDLRINRAVAIKILSGAMFGNREALRRFEREAQTAGRLQHRNIVTIFDYGTLSTEGAYLIMELLHGENLKDVLEQNVTLDLKIVVRWFSQVLTGLEAAHKAGIIHRDLKPDNIFVTKNESGTTSEKGENERLIILDFGIARLSETVTTTNVTVPGTIMGTLGYMPPEQLRGEKVDERADLFSVGVMIYECLYGRKPYLGRTYQEIVQSMSKPLEFKEDAALSVFCERSLAIAPENRFESAAEMKESLLTLHKQWAL